MRTPEEKILRAIGSITDDRLIAKTMPGKRLNLSGTVRVHGSAAPEELPPVSRLYILKRAVIGIAAAALVITGAVMLWRYIRYDYVDPDRTDFRDAAYSGYEDLPVLPGDGADDGSGRDNVLLDTAESGDGDSGLEYRVELFADNVYRLSADDPYMLVCDPYALVTDMNTGKEVGTLHFFPGEPRIMPAKGVKYDTGGTGMEWLRARTEFMYTESGTYPLFITQYAAEMGGMYTTFYGINADGELEMFHNAFVDKGILSEGNTCGMELSGSESMIGNYFIDPKRELVFGFDFENMLINVYKGTQPPEMPEIVRSPVDGPEVRRENNTVPGLPLQEKYLSDRLPAAGEGDAVSNDMLLCANGTVYQFITYGRVPYGDALKSARDLAGMRQDTVSELLEGVKMISDDGELKEEYLPLLQKAQGNDFFTNEQYTATDLYYIGENYMISVGSDEWGTGIRYLQRLTDSTDWGKTALGLRKDLELLWTAAAEYPDRYGDMSIVLVTSVMQGKDIQFTLEAVVRADTDDLTAYLTERGADMELMTVLTPEQERGTYLPVGCIYADENGTETVTDSYNSYGSSFLAWDGRVYRAMAVHTTEDVYRFAQTNGFDELETALGNVPAEELPEITPYEEIFDPVLMPYDAKGHKFFAAGTSYVIEKFPEAPGEPVGYVVYQLDGQMTIVRKEAVLFRLHPVFSESEEHYEVKKLDFVTAVLNGAAGTFERPKLRITADPSSHSLLEKVIRRNDFTPYYWEICE